MKTKLFTALLLLLPSASPARAQNAPLTDLNQRIERQVRAYTEAPPNAQVTIGARTPSNFAGYENLPVTIEANGMKKPVNFLIAKDGSKLLYVTEIDLREDPYAANMRKIDTRGRPFRGAENGPVTLVVYDDFECPFCSRMYVTLMNEVMTNYRDRVKIVMKDFPILDAHPWAMRAAVDAHCLADQDLAAYWEFSDYVHTRQQEISAKVTKAPRQIDKAAMDEIAKDSAAKHQVKQDALQACIAAQDESRVHSSLAEGKSLGVSATPTMFVNGQEVEGVLTVENLRVLLDHALSEAAANKPL
jgi:protein-disulfide isomerase